MKQLDVFKKPFIKAFQAFFEQEKQVLKEHDFFDVLPLLEEFCLSGKMIRGLLFLGVGSKGRLDDAQFLAEIMPLAISIELVHSAFLIHDDIMDQSVLRRGEDSLFHHFEKKYEHLFKGNQESRHFGYSMSICVGDLAFFLAQKSFNLFMSMHRDFSKSSLLLDQWGKVCLYQMQDLYFGVLPFHQKISEQDILKLYKGKTAEYTFSLPLVMGSAVSCSDEKAVEDLFSIGTSLGLLFQIRDDALDFFMHSSKTGKVRGQDFLEGKKTLYSTFLYASLDEEEKEAFLKLTDKKEFEAQDLAWIDDKALKYSTVKQVEALEQELSLSCHEKIKSLSMSDLWLKDLLLNLLEYNEQRES